MFKTTLKALGKITASGIIALMVLTLFYFFYNSTPMTYPNEDGATNYKWEANTLYFNGVEGFAWGKTNNDGFKNMFDYDDNMEIDVLIMGSSHMEASQVGMSQSTASRLNALLENETVYNIGVPSHYLPICARNLRSALNKYRPTKYVVIETATAFFSDEEIALAMSEERPAAQTPKHTGGIIGLLKKSSLVRQMYQKMQNYFTSWQAKGAEETDSLQDFVESDIVDSENLLNDLLHKMSLLGEEYGAKIIIAYHPYINIAYDGAIGFNDDQNTIIQFKKLCDDNGILFLDMSDRFKEEYESSYILPYGFANTPVGSGHMNQYGHAMMAEELYKLILEDEQ